MLVKAATFLNTSADRAWQAVKRSDTFLYITRGLAGFAGVPQIPGEWRQGEAARVRVLLFHLVPTWTQELRIVRVDDQRREIFTNEKGGMIRVWNHRMHVQPVSPTRCRYSDEVEIDAGLWTPLVWFWASLFFSYRQMRWRKLARSLTWAVPEKCCGE
jgi:hypothetical protein